MILGSGEIMKWRVGSDHEVVELLCAESRLEVLEFASGKSYLPSSLVRGVILGLARLEFICVFLSVSSVKVSKLLVGDGVVFPDLGVRIGVRIGEEGLEVAISYVGRSSDMGVRAGVRTAVL
jgi:hypothetical protein